MRFLLKFTSAPSAETRARIELKRARRDLVAYLRASTPRVVLIGAIGFAVGWIVNFQAMRKLYDGFNVPKFAPYSGKGSRLVGMLFWFVLSFVVAAFIGHWRQRGRAGFTKSITKAPARLRALVEQDRAAAVQHLLWGFAGSMVVMRLLGPALTGLTSASFLLFMGTAFRRLAVGVLMVAWRWVVSLVAPERATPPNPAAAAVGGMGGTLAMLVAWWIVHASGARLFVALLAGVAAYVIGQRREVNARAALLLIALGLGGVGLAAGTAWADDGGEAECSGKISGCAGVDTLAQLAGLGGAAAAAGAITGEAIGEGLDGGGRGKGDDDDDDDDDEDLNPRFPCGEDGAEEATSDWEAWAAEHPRGSWDEFMAERIEGHRQEALEKGRDIDRVQEELRQIDAELEQTLKDLNVQFDPTKPFSQMTAKEKQMSRAQLTRTWRQANPTGDPAEFMAYLQRLDVDPDLTSLDMLQYIAGESVLGLWGATVDAGTKTITNAAGAVLSSKEVAGNMLNNYLEELDSGEQADRLGRTFVDPVFKFWDDFHDRGPKAMLSDMSAAGIKVSQAGAKQFDTAMQQLHLALITGDAPGIAKVIDGAAGSIISDYLLTLGAGKVLSVTKQGISAMRGGGKGAGLVDDALRGTEQVLTGESIPLDTQAKRAAVGHSEEAAAGFQDAADKHGNVLQMQRRGEDAIAHEGKAYMKPQGGKYAKSVNPLDRHLGGPDEEGLLAFYEPVNPLAAPGSPLQKRYETVRTLFDSVPGSNLAEKQTYLTKNRLEVWVNGEKVKIPVTFDKKGVMRHTQTGRPITSDYDGWAVLDENGRRLGYTHDGQRLTGAAKQADREKKIPMIRGLVDDPRTNLQHAPTSSEWGPIPALLRGDKEAVKGFQCAINKIGENIVDAARKDGVVEYRPGSSHPYLTKAAGVKDAKAPTLKIPGKPAKKTGPTLAQQLAKGLVEDIGKAVVGAADKRASGTSTSSKPSKSTAKAPKAPTKPTTPKPRGK
jgi:hypothetical protein